MASSARDYPRSVRAFPAQIVLQRVWKGDLPRRSPFGLGRSEVALTMYTLARFLAAVERAERTA